ncbi:MAG: hypothetical protein NXI00_22675 [Cytophagales bacterium]|nr:hypothetical protein [Cytophagales bacterium]
MSINAPCFRPSKIGTPAFYANAAGKDEIAEILEDARKQSALTLENSMIINGKDVLISRLMEYKESLRIAEPNDSRKFELRLAPVSCAQIDLASKTVQYKISKIELINQVIELNYSVLPEAKSPKTKSKQRMRSSTSRVRKLKSPSPRSRVPTLSMPWEGVLRFPAEGNFTDSNWVSEFCKLHADRINFLSKDKDDVFLDSVYAIGVYSDHLTRFSLYFSSGPTCA